MQKHESAFTLIELLITITVAAVVLTIGVPGFERVIERNQLATNVNTLVSSMNFARSEAIKRNKRVKICDSTDSVNCGLGNYSQGWMIFIDENDDDDLDAATDELIFVQGAFPNNISIDPNLSTGANDISYLTGGRANRNGNFIICKNNDVSKARVIVIDMNGRARLTDLTPNGTPEDASGTAITTCT